MNQERINSHDLLTNYRSLLLFYIKNRYGRTRAKRHFEKKTGKQIGLWVMETALRSMRTLKKDKTYEELEYEDLEVLDILEHKKKIQRRKFSKQKKKHVVILPPEPFAIWCIGDPHLDNDGCEILRLMKEMEIVKRNKNKIYSGCVGDLNDNWIGRLGLLYQNTSITAEDGWKLSKWFLSQMEWLFLLGGNHDAWANRAGINPLQWLCQLSDVKVYGEDEVRIEIQWLGNSDLEEIRIQCRHDHKGRSWFHNTHGPNKAAILDGKDHIFLSGHIHSWGHLQTEQRYGRVTHAIRVKGYKQIDSYAKKNQFFTQEHGSSCLIVIDPMNKSPSRIQVFWDIETGAKYLDYLCSREDKTSDIDK